MSNAMMVWLVAAMLLIAAETLLPEIFLLWLGIAAAVVFFIVWAFPGTPPMWQAIAFVVLSVVSIGVYVKFIRGRLVTPDQPLLIKRGEQLVGKVKLGDALWTVEGPDLPVATLVKVVGATSMTLKVAPN